MVDWFGDFYRSSRWVSEELKGYSAACWDSLEAVLQELRAKAVHDPASGTESWVASCTVAVRWKI